MKTLLYFRSLLLTILAICYSGCANIPTGQPPKRVSLNHACEVMPPDNPGEHYQLTYHGLEIIRDGAPPALFRLPKGAVFSIDLFRVDTSGGMNRVYARGGVNSARGQLYPVEMYLRLAENPGIPQAVYDEIAKDPNRFWTVCKP